MKLLIGVAVFAFMMTISGVMAEPASGIAPACQKPSLADSASVFQQGCMDAKVYQIYYDKKTSRIVLKDGKRNAILQRIPKGCSPEIVGAEVFIGFLPDSLQVYKDIGVLAYVSSIRTNGGDGRGQCGAGAEIFLNFLYVRLASPKIASTILIGSCDESIEPMDQDASSGVLGKLSVVDKKLSLQFMHYRGCGDYPTATVSADLMRLEFMGAR